MPRRGLKCIIVAFFAATLAAGCAGGPERRDGKMKTEEKTITIKNTEMFYRTQGSGPPMVFVHGNTGSSIWFSRVMDISGYTTYAPDLPNFGNSGHIDTADIDLYADYLKGWMDALGLENPVVLGHSLGGAVVISLAIRCPESVKKLILVDSAPLAGLKTPEEHYPIIEQYKTNRDLMKQALGSIAPTLEDAAFLDRLADSAMKMNPIAYTGNARALERFDYRGKGDEYPGPVLVLVGEKDILITEESGKKTAAAFPQGEFRLIEGVGHSVMVEAPETFKKIVEEFLGE